MKKILFPLCFLLSAFGLKAQLKEGKAVYERTIQFQFRNQNRQADMNNDRPRSRTDRFELSFMPGQALWESLPDMDANMEEGGGGGNRFSMRFDAGESHSYYNFETGKRIDQRELNSKNYVVEDSIRRLSWKLTGETKPFLNYTARKAVAQRIGTRMIMAMENGEMKRQEVGDTTEITAWFTTEIPVPAGPEFGGQLPGLILELDMNNGRITYKAVEISPKVSVARIKEPKGGKRITAEEYAKERQKMMDEMRRNMPPGRMARTQN